MNTPNVAELLVQQTEKATRLAVEVEQLRQRLQEIARLSAECNDPDELRRELDPMLNPRTGAASIAAALVRHP